MSSAVMEQSPLALDASGNSPTLPGSARTLHILVTGGGTGGHTTPAVATIEAARSLAQSAGLPLRFTYLGSRHGVECGIAEGLAIPFIGVETGKLRRSRNPFGMLSAANLRDAFRVPTGYVQALAAVRRAAPDVVLSTGGYVSVPGVLAAAAARVPIVAHEQTVQVGLANRINFRFARVIALSVAETMAMLPEGQRRRAIVTGNPVREIVLKGDAARGAQAMGFDEVDGALPAVYVTGGAQGSSLINAALEAALPKLLQSCRIVHQCGRQDFDRLAAARERLGEVHRQRYAVVKFVGDAIGDVYALADLIVGRSGAGTVTEVCAIGKPAVFVPLTPTSGDEQMRNARRLERAGAAAILAQDALSGESLAAAILEIVGDRERTLRMGRCALTLAAPNAARELATLVLSLAEAH